MYTNFTHTHRVKLARLLIFWMLSGRDDFWLVDLQALASASQSRSLLKELFADIALEVDDRAKGKSRSLRLLFIVSVDYCFT